MLLMLLLCVTGMPCLAGETATLRNGFSIHYERRESLGETTRLYLAESADSFVDVLTNDIIEIEADKIAPAARQAPAKPRPPVNRPIQLDEALSAASRSSGVSTDLLRSVVRAESGFNPKARSSKGAQGLMQLMPATAARMGVRDAFDPNENLNGGARYLQQLLGRYNNNLTLTLAAYNAGPERVEKYHGVPPFPETVSYVTRVLQNLNIEQRQGGSRSFTLTQQSPQSERRSSAPNLEAIRQFQETIARESGQDGSADEAEPSSQPVESN